MSDIQSQISCIQSQLEVAYPKDEARALAWWIIEESTGLSRSQLLCDCKSTKNISNLQEIIARLLHFEPIQYIFGHTLWNNLDLKVTPATLIPRPETAELVEKLSTFHFPLSTADARVLDIGTGSGCIAIALKKAHPEWQVTGIDISPEAIGVAKENARRNEVDIEFHVADIFSDFIGHFDIIVSNPPYICEREKSAMRPNVLEYEPATALFVPDDDPLRFYHRIAELFAHTPDIVHRTPKYLFFEINEAYPEELAAMLGELGYTDIHITKDIYGKARIIDCRMVG